eukprot:SAG22_NODE_384_length_11306_cov_12.130365_7_plen_263_part_00
MGICGRVVPARSGGGQRQCAGEPWLLLRERQGVKPDRAEAEKWFRLGALGGDTTAIATMADRYANGRGLVQSVSTTVTWNQLAAEHGVVAAAAYLARAYSEGRGITPDAEAADRWRRQAAAGGDVASCRLLVVRRPADPLSSKWRLVLAEHGDVESQYYLGWCHEHGTDSVPQSLSEAVRWYELAADQGETRATERCLAISEAMELDPSLPDPGAAGVAAAVADKLSSNALLAHLDAEYERLLEKAEKYSVPVAASWVIADE